MKFLKSIVILVAAAFISIGAFAQPVTAPDGSISGIPKNVGCLGDVICGTHSSTVPPDWILNLIADTGGMGLEFLSPDGSKFEMAKSVWINPRISPTFADTGFADGTYSQNWHKFLAAVSTGPNIDPLLNTIYNTSDCNANQGSSPATADLALLKAAAL